MKRQTALLAAALLGCSGPAAPELDRLMDQIEAQARPPDGARPLGAYVRYYSYDRERRVIGLYFTPNGDADPPPGTRRWLSSEEMLWIADGGCSVLTLRYDPATRRLDGPACNGVA